MARVASQNPKLAAKRIAQQKYAQSVKGRAYYARYAKSSAASAAQRRYQASDKGRIARHAREQRLGRKLYRLNWMRTEKGRAIQRRYITKRREWLQQEKLRRGCKDCGYNEHPAALDFDHVRGAKRFELSKCKRSLRALKAELRKCVVRCSNCHRIRTYEARQTATDKRRIR